MTELTTAPSGAPLADDDIFLVRKGGEAGIKKATGKNFRDYIGANPGTPGKDGVVPYRFGAFFVATPAANEVLMLHVACDPFSLPAALAGSRVNVGTAPSAATVLSVRKNGAEIATISIATTGAATLAMANANAIVAGDLLSLVAPAASNGLANVAITFKGV